MFGGNQSQIKAHLEAVEVRTKDNEGGQHHTHIAALKEEINLLLMVEELHWKQRSRATWLEKGIITLKFFHNSATQRRKNNQIEGLFNSQDQWCMEVDQLKSIGEDYFQEQFTSSTPQRMEEAMLAVDKVVS
jgi:hypothetical protein